MKEDVLNRSEDAAAPELERAMELLGTARCPWQFDCEAVHAPERRLNEFAGRMFDEAVILARMLLAERGEECTYQSLNAVLGDAQRRWASNRRAEDGAGDRDMRLSGTVLGAMEERRKGGAA